ncbi:hypothetical protein KIW84_063009 [Lathyrus oleraceus]|uniref:Reverse transcriptase domain-containing protein n=1 Tax=Pisum sativum TaxID=3888 RepID=A0A9D4W7U6_PEA|nr:hypothetical protein KIW84_063009 [Pisum sativum]
MPYEYPRPTPMIMAGPSTLPNQGVEELRDEDRSRAWIREREELLQQIKEKDALIEFLEHQVIDDPDNVCTSLLPQSSKFWKRRYDRLAKEKADMEAAYEREVKRLRASCLPVSRALDDYKLTHRYYTRANISRLIDHLEQENREALQKVLDVAYVDHDVTLEQFDSIVANITACNNLSFCDSDLPEEGRDHNLALHISMGCRDDAMSNVLVDTGSSLNVLPKSTLSKLSYQGPPMRQSGVVVKAFDGSRKTVIGEVDLPIKIGPSDFQITFQFMDIHPSYSCLLGKPWIHEAGAMTSTLHQKLKFVKNKKLVVVGGERALLVSHLSSCSYIDAEVEIGTPFQALSIAEPIEKRALSFASYRDAKLAIECGATAGLGKMIELEDNKSRVGIGFSSGVFNEQGLFKSGGFIHTGQDEEEVAAVLEEDTKDSGNFIIPGGVCNNWVVVDIPTVVHKSTLISKPIEHNDPTPSPNFEFPVFEAEEDDVEEIPDEITRLLEHEEKIIQTHLENLETVNLGSEDCVREVKIGALLEESVKKGLIELLREYVDVFAWSYEDMPGLDTDIVQHFLPLKPECVPVKQKLRRTHPDMAVKIKEEVQKQYDAGFLVTSTYPQWVANIVLVPKKDGKVWMCVDYRDLNKASPKDDFPLPHIDMLVDNTAKFKVFSFMDGFSGYNQIKMAPEDMEKTTFITP